MKAFARAILAVVGIAGMAGVSGPALGDPPALLDALIGNERVSAPLAELAARIPLADGEDFRVEEIGRDAHTSHHLVAIRKAETPHRHDRHDLWVVILRGQGSWLLGGEVREAGEGSIFYVPRGTLHAFRNASRRPAIAYAIYAPAFDGKDRVTAE